jgi:Uma2 family endonuclease
MGQVKTLMTAEQIPTIAAAKRTELVRGELIEMSPVGGPHSATAGLLLSWIIAFARPRRLGIAGPEWGFVLFRDPDTVRAPDVCFIAAARIAAKGLEGFFEGAPDLAVEVVSPEDRASEVQEKVREYLAAGTRLVWVIDPQTQTVAAYHPSGDAHIYAGDDQVPAEDVLPGFSFRCRELFTWD